MEEARFYLKEKDKLRCVLCPRFCLLGNGQVGTCGVRRVENDQFYTTNYGVLAAANWDPIEKKPLYHFHPGRSILSVGTYGCNLLCSFCQNWSLARGKPGDAAELISPEDILGMLEKEGGPDKALGVAYTYNEPSIWYEFVYDTARLLHDKGYCNVLVTNGYINREPLKELLPFIDAMNIDVKAFSESFYREYCHGLRDPVIETVEAAAKKCHVEITCLLIPTLNDSSDEQEALARWLGEINPDLVLHYSRYFPQYKLDLPATPPEVMERARETAKKYLRYVYLGNIILPGSSDTNCPYCGNLLIMRGGSSIRMTGLDGSNCNSCSNKINIVLPDSLC